MKGDLDPFWMVVGDGPTIVRHKTPVDANNEAKRLARLHPGKWFFVTEAVGAHRVREFESIAIRRGFDIDDDIPF